MCSEQLREWRRHGRASGPQAVPALLDFSQSTGGLRSGGRAGIADCRHASDLKGYDEMMCSLLVVAAGVDMIHATETNGRCSNHDGGTRMP